MTPREANMNWATPTALAAPQVICGVARRRNLRDLSHHFRDDEKWPSSRALAACSINH
jgi:hypothetical protein